LLSLVAASKAAVQSLIGCQDCMLQYSMCMSYAGGQLQKLKSTGSLQGTQP